MKNNNNPITITLSDIYGDKVTYDTTDFTTHELVEVFIRIARHMTYTDESIDKAFKDVEIFDNY